MRSEIHNILCIRYNIMPSCMIVKLVFLQFDPKGLPSIVMALVLKTHPVCAVKCLRKHFSQQQRQYAQQGRSLPGRLPDWSVSERNSLSTSRGRFYEDGVPVVDFLREEQVNSDGETS